MLRLLGKKRASATAEFAILIGVIVGAALAMQTYVKRAWQSNLKHYADELSYEGRQYEPYYLSSSFNSASDDSQSTSTALGGGVTRETNKKTQRTGQQEYGYEGE